MLIYLTDLCSVSGADGLKQEEDLLKETQACSSIAILIAKNWADSSRFLQTNT